MSIVITFRDWSSGDWSELCLGDTEIHQGHSIPDFVWLQLLRDLGFTVIEELVEEDDD